MEGLWDFGLEKSLRVQNLTSVPVGAWEIRTLRTGEDGGGLTCGVLEGCLSCLDSIRDICYLEPRVFGSGSGGLKNLL